MIPICEEEQMTDLRGRAEDYILTMETTIYLYTSSNGKGVLPDARVPIEVCACAWRTKQVDRYICIYSTFIYIYYLDIV